MAATPLTLVTEEFAPYSYREHGKVTGYATDVLEAALAHAGIDHSVQIYPWARAFQMARSQPNVLIYSIVRTPEREELFQWVTPLAPRSVYLYKLASRRDIKVRTVEDLRRYRIAANRGDVVEEQLHQLGLNADLGALDETNLRKVVVGRVDLMVASERTLKDLCQRIQVRCSQLERAMPMPGMGDYYVAASLGTPPATVQAVRTELEKLKSSGFMQRTADKYGLTLR
ncbi:transporter substrate-binding domain-containing protein [Duganella sp. FT135W]|uniref:Transporter substrate-binding domain-containing protein n=1 Tax=Duganella flavida TaxID=2692175 RepID=A0A6L8K8Y7_9BURK|nr:transporter substrate-binding domain-containing protein [Duganella flavida]